MTTLHTFLKLRVCRRHPGGASREAAKSSGVFNRFPHNHTYLFPSAEEGAVESLVIQNRRELGNGAVRSLGSAGRGGRFQRGTFALSLSATTGLRTGRLSAVLGVYSCVPCMSATAISSARDHPFFCICADRVLASMPRDM
jgi:hypothetical protein